MKRTPLIRKKPMKRGTLFSNKKRTGLRKVSTRRAKEMKEYRERKKSFMKLPGNQFCPVHLAGIFTGDSNQVKTRDVHHMAGREGKLLNDERYWLAVSRAGHNWIHANPNEARRRGWLI